MRSKTFTSLNFSVLCISLCLGTFLWYAITINDRMDMQVEIKLEYKNIPKNLIITEGLVDTITTVVRGPKALLQSHNTQRTHIFDLSTLRKGKNVIPFAAVSPQGKYRAFEVLSVSPGQMIVYTDSYMERNVPIKAKLINPLHSSAFKVTNITTSPNTALIRGPEKTVSKMGSLTLDVRVSAEEQPGTYTKNFPLITDKPQTSVTPTSVAVQYTVASKRTTLHIEKKIIINGAVGSYIVEPTTVQLHIELPEALTKNSSYLNGIEVRLTPPLLELNQSAVVRTDIILPEGISLIKEPQSQDITVTRVK